jgi:hypothetical protein
LFGDLGGIVELVIRHITDDFVQCGEMITHVSKHVLLPASGQVHANLEPHLDKVRSQEEPLTEAQ